MTPKVLHVSAAQLSSGGVERFLLGLCQSLREDYAFALLSGAQKQFSDQVQVQGCAVFSWDVRRTFDRSAARQLSETIQSYRPDIVHVHDARAGLITRLWKRNGKMKIVYTVHLPPYYYRWGRFTGLRRFMYATLERILNAYFTDKVVYPSRRGWEDALRHRYAPAHKAVCIPNGIDLHPFELAQSERKDRVDSAPVICAVARLSPEKNVGLLLEASALLKKQGKLFSLWIVGNGPQRAELEKQAEELGLASQTRFWGQQVEIAPILFQVDIFALTSWYEGGRAQAVMEAQAAGLPCVLSDVGDNASMADADSGLLFSEGDVSGCAEQLGFLLTHPQDRLGMGANARRRAFQVYNLQIMADQYRQVYQALLSDTAPSE